MSTQNAPLRLPDAAPSGVGERLFALLPIFVLLSGIALTLLLDAALRSASVGRSRAEFVERTSHLEARVTRRLRDDEQVLRGGAGLFQVLPEVSREDWHRYVDSLRFAEHYPGILGVGVALWLTPGDVDGHVARVRADGLVDFRVWPPGARDAYVPVMYLEPVDWRNRRALGFDMLSEPTRRAAIERARDGGEAALAGPVVLVQETPQDPQIGLLMYLPMYRRGAPLETVADRRAALVGFAYSPIRVRDLVDRALRVAPVGVAFDVFAADSPSPEARLYGSVDADVGRPTDPPAHERTSTVDVFGRPWTFRYRSLPSFAGRVGLLEAQGSLIGGLLVSAAASVAALALGRQRRRAAALRRAQAETEARFRSYFDLPLVGAALTSPAKGWIAVNDRMCSMLGYSREELLGRTWAELTHPEDLAADVAEFQRVIAREQDGYTLEKRFVRKDGRPLHVRLAVQCVRDAAGDVEHFAALADDQTEQRIVTDRLRESEERFAAAFDHAPIMMTLSRVDDGTYLAVNERFVALSGYSREEAIGRTSVELGWVSAEDRARLSKGIRDDGRVDGLELTLRARGGKPVMVGYSGVVLTIRGEQRLLSIAKDLTVERTLQRSLEQAQKLESVGRLAGGVAHDFNNMLAVIRGYAELLLQRGDWGEEARDDLEQIREAADRSAQVTRQLLTFARKQVVEPKVLDLNDTVAGMLKMLRRLIGEDIDLLWSPGFGLRRVRVDPSQIDQVLANLCVNARDAIAGVGKIAIETGNVALDPAFCQGHDGIAPGEYVRLTVTDSGTGIASEVLPHVFEPFFTTKEVGRGSGLGLATVYGIARQNGGAVEVESLAGSGAVFRVYLPVAADGSKIEPAVEAAVEPTRKGAGELVLVVEDEPAVLRLCAQILRRLGYEVLSASRPDDAIALAEQHGAAIRLLVTDVVMPGMSGVDLAERVTARVTGVRCLFMSGYTPDTVARHGVGSRVVFVQKPFEGKVFAARVREALA